MKKIYVLDTSVYLTDHKAIFAYGKNDIVIPMMVLEEIDNHKRKQDSVGSNARSFIRFLDSLREKGSLYSGVKIKKGSGILYCRDLNKIDLPDSLDPSIPDHKIIGTALTLKRENIDKEVILISSDINMRIKCDALNLRSEEYIPDHIIKSKSELYSGITSLLVDDQIIDRIHLKEEITLNEEEVLKQKVKLYPNQFILLISSSNNKKSCLVRFFNYTTFLRKVQEKNVMGGSFLPKNKEQACALDILLDPKVQVVSLVGRSGGGKTLTAIAAGLSQILNFNGNRKDNIKPIYNRLIVTKPVQPVGKDIGFLPGEKNAKLLPWLTPVEDNLRYLLGDDKTMFESYIERGIIELEALTYIRGRSIQNAFILLDESQNLSKHEVKTILTRVGEGSKIVLTGDIEQIDNINLDETSNGLTHVIEKLKPYEFSGHISLTKGERSSVATVCSEVL